jgi:alginate O-acetyltransferase complex protein AlgI
VWGALNGLFLMLEQMQWIPTKRMKWKPLRHFYTMLVVTLAFVIFRADSLSQAGQMYAAMFTGISVSGLSLSAFAQLLSPVLIVTLVAAIVGCMPVLPYVQNRLRNYRSMRIVQCTAYMATVPLLVLCIMNLSVSAYNPFIYFRF